MLQAIYINVDNQPQAAYAAVYCFLLKSIAILINSGNNINAMKKTSLAIAICIMLNNFASVGAIEAPIADISTPVMQASVFQLASLIRLPFAVTAKIMNENAPLLPQYKKTPGQRQTEKNKKDSKGAGNCGYSLFSTENYQKPDIKTFNFYKADSALSEDLICGSGIMWVNLIFYWLGFKYIFLLACLISLSKSSLPWEIRNFYA
jgi:hypothetical protein